jgi:murein DD-endopeptidase MepM/ murein hydrolase activator NlpD
LLLSEFIEFLAVVRWYTNKKIGIWGGRFEVRKDFLVDRLMMRRGVYQRPFLHVGMVILLATGMLLAPVVANTYPGLASDPKESDIPPSAVLNTAVSSETTTQISEKPRDQVITYTVKPGDTLSSIALDKGVSIDTIRWANESKIVSIHDIRPGQEILIPPVTGVVHKVRKGETVYSIAKKYDTNPQKIVDFPFNDFADNETFALSAGQSLIVPDGVVPEVQLWAAPPSKPVDVGSMTAGGTGQFSWPVGGIITQRRTWYHTGLDIANPGAPDIGVADSGRVVVVVRSSAGYGWYVVVDHGNGFSTLYAHLQAIYVELGQNVTKGQAVGKMGSTGRSTGTHLHFEVRKNGVALDPVGFLK